MEQFNFQYKVQLDDLDYMNHVGNANWLTFLERARVELMSTIGFPITEMMKRRIFGVVSESNLKYLKQAKYNDILDISISVARVNNRSVNLNYNVTNADKLNYLKAEIAIVFINDKGRTVDIPIEIEKILKVETVIK